MVRFSSTKARPVRGWSGISISGFPVALLWLLGMFALAPFAQGALGLSLDKRFQPVLLSQSHAIIKLAPYSLVLEDSGQSLTIDDINTPERQLQFAPHAKGLEFGYTAEAVWIAFVLDNQSQEEDEYLLEVGYPLIDSITLFEPQYDALGDNLHWRAETLGDRLPFNARPFKLRTFVFKLKLQPGEVKPYFLRVASTSSLSVPLTLYSEDAYYEYLHYHQTYIGIFYGICFGLLAYNLFLYGATREKSYLLYLGVVLSNVYTASCFDGFNYIVLPWFPYWQNVAIYASMCITLWFSHQFTRVYLQTHESLPRFDRVLRGLSLLAIAEFVLFLVVPGKLMSIAILATVALTIITILATAALKVRRGYEPAKLFLAAWIVMLSPIFIGVLNALNILSFHEVTPYIHKIGVAGEMIILSLALGSRINILKQAEQEALQLATRAEAEGKAKSDFLAKMSHEIRTPMNGVLGMAELLTETPLKPNQLHYVRTIYNSGQALLSIINDILDYSKIEAGKLVLERVEFNLEDLLDECVSVFALRSSDQKVPLIALVDPGVPKMVKGDPTRLRQVIINLLGNAFKFTERGQIRCNVLLDHADLPRLRIKCEFIDSGIGISEEQQKYLFKSFSQADASTTRKYGGTGLGLAICKELVELMGGEIGVQSKPGHGSCFWFTAELEACADQRNPQVDELVRQLTGRTLLVVDDNVHIRTVVKTLAESWGMQVLVAESGLSAVELVADIQRDHRKIDVALLDFQLSDMSGIDLSRRIQQMLTQPFPHLLLTAARQLPREAELEGSGIAIIVEQPIPSSHLRKSLARAILGNLSDAEVWFEKDLTHPEYAGLRVLVADDNTVNQLVVVGMLKRLGVSPDVATNGQEAVDLVKTAREPYDVILMDCEMPILDGYAATRQIRQYESAYQHHTVIYALTAHAMEDYLHKSRTAGMDDHIAKPVSMDDLNAALERATGLLRSDP